MHAHNHNFATHPLSLNLGPNFSSASYAAVWWICLRKEIQLESTSESSKEGEEQTSTERLFQTVGASKAKL